MKTTFQHVNELAMLYEYILTRKAALFPRNEGDVLDLMISHLFSPWLPSPHCIRMPHLLSLVVAIKYQKNTIHMNIYTDEFTSQGDVVFSQHNLPTPPPRRLTPHTTTVAMATMRQRADWLLL